MKFNFWFLMGSIYVASIFGIGVGLVGQYPKCDKFTPYEWWMPFILLAMYIFPFILGYLAGKDKEG